jgi:hypothetical protein
LNSRTAARLAWSIWALCVPLAALGGILSFLTAFGQSGAGSGLVILLGVLLLTFPTVGALVASRRPENPIGWIFCAVSLVIGIGLFTEGYAAYALHASPAPSPGVQYAAWFSSWTGGPGALLAAAFLFLLFPTGTLPSRRWRLVAWTAAIGGPLTALGLAVEPGPLEAHRSVDNPVAIGGTLGAVVEVLGSAGGVALNLSVLAAGISLILRLRRSRGVERQQLKWFVYSAVLMGGGFAASIVFSSGPVNSIAWSSGILGFMSLPLAVGIALLRYRLYDIDRIINRTLVYGALTAVLVAVYLVSVVALRGLVFGFTGRSSQLVVVASTLTIAALFNPLRWRLQGFIDRLFYRRKYNAARTLETFSGRLRNETDLEELNGNLVSVVRETLQPEHASLWLRAPEERG